MNLSDVSFVLMIIIEGCAGPLPSGKCTAQNFSIRVPYDRIEQCEEAKKRIAAPGGIQKYIKGMCLAVPKNALQPEPVS
jgi:hypothetical protein